MSDPIPPIVFKWEGDVMRPLRGFEREADRQYVIGEQYRLSAIEERSINSHRHYFAQIHDVWLNLREAESDQFSDETHLRSYALIKVGYRNTTQYVAASKADAIRLADFIRPFARYAVITVEDRVVSVHTARSQSVAAMGKKAFQDSKEKVLDYLVTLIDVTREQLARNTREGNR